MAKSIKTSLCCSLLVAVAIVLCMAAGASAQLTPYCFTSKSSAVVSDALQAIRHQRLQGKDKICQANCEGDHACTVVDKYQTAQLKLCGGCNVCEGYPIADYLFSVVFHVCGGDGSDGTYRVLGKLGPSNEDYEVVTDGKRQNVDADYDMKLSK